MEAAAKSKQGPKTRYPRTLYPNANHTKHTDSLFGSDDEDDATSSERTWPMEAAAKSNNGSKIRYPRTPYPRANHTTRTDPVFGSDEKDDAASSTSTIKAPSTSTVKAPSTSTIKSPSTAKSGPPHAPTTHANVSRPLDSFFKTVKSDNEGDRASVFSEASSSFPMTPPTTRPPGVSTLAAKFGHKSLKKYIQDAPKCIVHVVRVPNEIPEPSSARAKRLASDADAAESQVKKRTRRG
jgi:hypothetical protein